MDKSTAKILYKDGEPCKHPGCLSHVSHPCEGCGRTAGRGHVFMGVDMGNGKDCAVEIQGCYVDGEFHITKTKVLVDGQFS